MAKTAIDGRSPVSIAAAVLFFTSTLFEQKVTARQIYEIANVSESTIKL
jgi:transcription initiation factor TFIIB